MRPRWWLVAAAGVVAMLLWACGPESAVICTGAKARLETRGGASWCGYRCRVDMSPRDCPSSDICVRVREIDLRDDPEHDGICVESEWLCRHVPPDRLGAAAQGRVDCYRGDGESQTRVMEP